MKTNNFCRLSNIINVNFNDKKTKQFLQTFRIDIS